MKLMEEKDKKMYIKRENKKRATLKIHKAHNLLLLVWEVNEMWNRKKY